MEEYASRRFTFSCTRAEMLPSVIESAAEIQTGQNQPGVAAANNMRSSTAKAAALGAVDISPTIGAGAPSYTSGVHTWKGAEATLKPMPTNISATAVNTRAECCPPWILAAIV